MKKTIILFVILLIGAGATVGVLTSASLGWTFKSFDGLAVFTLSEEEYQLGGILLEVSDKPLVWVDPDEITTNLGNITIEIPGPITGDIRLYTDKGNYFLGEPVLITIENNGDKDACYCDSYNYWTIEQYQDGDWKRIFPPVELLIVLNDCISPGEREEGLWNINNNAGDYRVTVSYFIEEEKYKFTEYSYFSITTFSIPIDNTILGDVTLELPDHPMVWKDYEDILIPLPPMQTIPFDDIFPNIPIEKVSMGEYFDATDSITKYNATYSIKIYNPYDGYWWFPIYPYLVE